jgi:RNA polymerase-binding transcription factor DksA
MKRAVALGMHVDIARLIMRASTTKEVSSERCAICGKPISKARLEALPGVRTCIECVKKNPPRIDASKYDLSESSPINRNGFAPKD